MQHVTEISMYQDDEVIENQAQRPRMANTSIRSRMLDDYKYG